MTLKNEQFLQFLSRYCPQSPPMLLGLSGGPDSMALFHLLLENKYPFEVAHIDHGWRIESSEESRYLEGLCQRHQLFFHCLKLPPSDDKKNLEDKGRKARLSFFRQITEKRKLKGVFLAHHADDQAETILKRIFEGASLPKLKGLLPQTEVEGILLLRPLLQSKKKDILQWLEGKKIPFFSDPTNKDIAFLRNRLREDLIPSLSDRFGKEISSNLCKMAESAAELSEFLQEMIQPYREKRVKTEEGISLDFSGQSFPPLFLCKIIIRDFFELQKLTISQATVAKLLHHLQKGSSHISLKVSKHCVEIHQKRILLKLL